MCNAIVGKVEVMIVGKIEPADHQRSIRVPLGELVIAKQRAQVKTAALECKTGRIIHHGKRQDAPIGRRDTNVRIMSNRAL